MGNVFILLLLMGVNRLGQPREEVAETNPSGTTKPVRGLEVWKSLRILGWQLGLGS